MKFYFSKNVGHPKPGIPSKIIVPLSVLLSVLLLSACGDSSSDSGNAAIPAGTSGPTTNGNPASGTTGDTDNGGTTGGDGAETSEPDSEAPEIDSEQTSFFFSYDESASTASRDLALNALANGRKPRPELGRPYEFLNAEQLGANSGELVGPFNVSMGLQRSENGDIPLETLPEGSVYGLGVNIIGPTQNLADRRNVVLTVLLDISGSMDSPYADETASDASSLLDVAKIGLTSMQQSLKQGDVINLVTFGSTANTLLEAHSPTQNSLDNVIAGIFTTGSTDINTGMIQAYEVANRTYDATKANRVVLVTDAFVNTGVVDPDEIAKQTTINGLEGIYFSGVGVGGDFNDRVLNVLTDVGKGSYSAMITPADGRRIFTDGFSRFMTPAARDVRFQLTYPQEMDQLKSFAEEISTVAEDVQTINFSYNSSQYFLELFSGPSQLSDDGDLRLDITYKNEDGQPLSVSVSRDVNTILGQGVTEIKAATAVATLAQLINGSLDCETVLSSQLYNTPVQHNVYTSYIGHIERFCGL